MVSTRTLVDESDEQSGVHTSPTDFGNPKGDKNPEWKGSSAQLNSHIANEDQSKISQAINLASIATTEKFMDGSRVHAHQCDRCFNVSTRRFAIYIVHKRTFITSSLKQSHLLG